MEGKFNFHPTIPQIRNRFHNVSWLQAQQSKVKINEFYFHALFHVHASPLLLYIKTNDDDDDEDAEDDKQKRSTRR